ncbi:DUF4450 domain-containing protein [Chitinophaga tropicalis]|nr:DUF4450 domain-containing protein [Chitinophaga tropicalis]
MSYAQELYPVKLPPGLWHNEQRMLRYHPEDRDFVITNGNRRFTRALYGTNTAFRVETGDLPEFALYMPGMGGNLRTGIIKGNNGKWLTAAGNITARYRPGMMIYTIKDSLLGSGQLQLTVMAMAQQEGMIIRAYATGFKEKATLVCVFGGATGKKFSRDGDMGPDPESVYYLQAANCRTNSYTINGNGFELCYGDGRSLNGTFPSTAIVKTGDATKIDNPQEALSSSAGTAPVLTMQLSLENDKPYDYIIYRPENNTTFSSAQLPALYEDALRSQREKFERITITTPDPYINTVGGALSVAADAIWEEPSYLHGAVGWRMRLNGWRGPYTGDALGWHDRALTHFRAYAASQVKEPDSAAVVADTAMHLARSKEKPGIGMFTTGYISRDPLGKSIRAHHYDMNLVYIDQLLRHFMWTGRLAEMKEFWPVLQSHLAWEKRNFDADGDGLYDAYAAIWASDALQYSGGGVAHSSAYNYFANIKAAEIAGYIGKDPTPYKKEAEKVRNAMNNLLWLRDKGTYGEYKDLLGNKLIHTSPAIWTIYHSIDSEVPDAFQTWQSLRYIDNCIPHIPVRATGLKDNGYYTLATSSWMPYTWSLNNVALAESMHTALANWQGGRADEAFRLFKSEVLASMYLGGSPGNFVQISHYDASRGEAYRDFGDPVGMFSRALIEGLFGIQPDLMHHVLNIRPGFPYEWDSAAIASPDIDFRFKRKGQTDSYVIRQRLGGLQALRFSIIARAQVKEITINGKKTSWHCKDSVVGHPVIAFTAPADEHFDIRISWQGAKPVMPPAERRYQPGTAFSVAFNNATILEAYDPQQALQHILIGKNRITAGIKATKGSPTFFLRMKQGMLTWWMPVCFRVATPGQPANTLTVIKGNTETIDLSAWFNDKVTSIFTNKYLSPRPQSTTLQLPWQGIGDWPRPHEQPAIDDSGLRKLAGSKNEISFPNGLRFRTPGDADSRNILFTSQWDNYPGETSIPLRGSASHMWLLMAGSTNPMQSRMDNGAVYIEYTDGSRDSLMLCNPDTWWPIEKDYYADGFAFKLEKPRPPRIHLKTGELVTGDAFNGRTIEGGAATVLELPLNPQKTLRSLRLKTITNDVVIGLMGVTLLRK